MNRPPVPGEALYRTVEGARVLDLLLLHGWAFALRGEERALAERQAAAALERLVGLGLPFARSGDGARLFDPVEALNFLRWAGVRGDDPTWIEHCLPTARRLAGAADEAERFAFTLRRTFNLKDRAPGTRVRLRLPLPLEDGTLDDLRTEIMRPPGLEAEIVSEPARLDVITAVPDDGVVSVAYRASFTTRPWTPAPAAGRVDPDEAELYTRPSEGLIRVNSRVADLAERLSGGETDSGAVVRRFWGFMMDDLSCGALHYDQLDGAAPLDWVLEHGWYDCKVGSALLAALCRARGIPARMVGGYMLHPASPAIHTWLEVWIDGSGWTPFDLITWDLAAGDGDPAWRDRFFGRLHHRMATERPPRLFNGAGSVRLPPAWHMLTAQAGDGCAVEFRALETGELVYRDDIEIERLEGEPQ